MSRPTYETRDTLAAEQEAAQRFADKYGLELHKLPRRYEIDYMVMRKGRLYGWLEVKCRPGVDRYSTYSVSVAKLERGLSLSTWFGGRFLLLVLRSSGLAVLDAGKERPIAVVMGGRSDRGDRDDVEPAGHFKWDQFKMLDAISE